jgi:hypothetical protein
MNLKNLFLLFSILLTLSIHAQNVVYDWAVQFKSSDHCRPYHLEFDPDSNLVIAGTYNARMDADPSNVNYYLEHVDEADAFIAKLSPEGNLIWAYGITGEGDESISNIELDQFGNIYVTGSFYEDIDVSMRSESHVFHSAGQTDMFVCKYSPDGDLIWAHQLGNYKYNFAYGFELDEEANLYISGYFSRSMDFDPGTDSTILECVDNYTDIFVLKLNKEGDFVWVKQLKGSLGDFNRTLHLDSENNILLAGNFRGELDFDPGDGVYQLTSNGEDDMYLCKLDQNGSFIWAHSFGKEHDEFMYHINTDSHDDVFVLGSYSFHTNLNTGPEEYLIESQAYTGFIAKYSKDGDFQWGRNIGEGENSKAIFSRIKFDSEDNIYGIGNLSGEIDVDPSENEYILSVGFGVEDILIMGLSSEGDLYWAKTFGRTSSQEYGQDLLLDQEGSIISCGYFQGGVDFDPGEGVAKLYAQGYWDGFVQKMNPCQYHYDWERNRCDEALVSPSGKYIWEESGIYFDTLQVPHECTKYYRIDFTNTIVDDTIMVSNDTLILQQSDAIYSWLHQFDEYEPISEIPNANESVYVIDTNGYYAARINLNGCIDTTAFIYFDSSWFINSLAEFDHHLVYPNPTNDIVNILFEKKYQQIELILYDQAGHQVLEQEYFNANSILLNIEKSGFYFLHLQSNGEKLLTQKILVLKRD